jgi:hypothetical protein
MVANQNRTFLYFHTFRIEQENPSASRFEEKEKWPADAFPIHTETRNMLEQAVLAEYEKIVGESDSKGTAKHKPEAFL